MCIDCLYSASLDDPTIILLVRLPGGFHGDVTLSLCFLGTRMVESRRGDSFSQKVAQIMSKIEELVSGISKSM